MIISEYHIPREELNNLTCILLARVYPLHIIIKYKKALIHICSNLLSQRVRHTEPDIVTRYSPKDPKTAP